MSTAIKESAILYSIIKRRDESYDDIFCFAVKTTGIYCRPSCAARRPLAQNCIFFTTSKEAEKAGFRACKRCRPNQPKEDIATAIIAAIKAGNFSDLKASNRTKTIHIVDRHMRRLVKNKIGKTPLQLDRFRRLQTAMELLLRTELPIAAIAFQSDFSSIRQFNYSFKQQYGHSPRHIRLQATRPHHE